MKSSRLSKLEYDVASAGGGDFLFQSSQKQRRLHLHFENILFPDVYSYASIKRIKVPPKRMKPLQDLIREERSDDILIRFQRSLENYITSDGNGFGGPGSKSEWFWSINSSDWNPILLSTKASRSQSIEGQENMDGFKEFLKRRGEFLIYAKKWSDPFSHPDSKEILRFFSGVRIGITNFGNLIVNFKNGRFRSEEETKKNRDIKIYEIRQIPLQTDGEKNQLNNILLSVIIPFLNWTSQIKPIYRGGVINFNWFFSIIRCPFETILPLLVSFMMYPLSESIGQNKIRRPSTSDIRPDSSQLLLKQIGLFQKQRGVIQRETKLFQRQEILSQKQRGLDQRERILKQTQEQFRRHKKHKVVNDAELAQLLSSYPILNQDIFKHRVKSLSRRFGIASLFRIFFQFLRDPDSPLFLFHGTDSSSRKRIQDQGIRTDVSTNIVYGQGFYLTTNPEEALRYAEYRFRERRRTRRCMSPILLVFKISAENAKSWVLGTDFNLKDTPPYYIVCQNQEKLKDLEMVNMIFLEERCS